MNVLKSMIGGALIFGSLFSSFQAKCASKAKKQPNLLLIITDEHNFRTLGCYRDQMIKEQAFMWGEKAFVETPHIDALAANGTLFTSMYGSTPTCTPSRASMFTGLYPHTLGMHNNSSKPGDGKYLHADVPTFGQLMHDAGYSTCYVGKWHLAEKTDPEEFWQPHPVGKPGHNYGFEHNKYMFNGGHDKFKGIDKDGNPYRADKKPVFVKNDEYGQPVYKDDRAENVKFTTDWLSDRAIEYLDEVDDKPFFCVVSIPDPHTPNVVRAPYDKMWDDVEIELPRTYQKKQKDDKRDAWRKPDGKSQNEEKLKNEIRQYFGMVKCIDDNVGRMLAKLEEKGVLENTIVVFTSDHGDLLGEHGRVNKGVAQESSARIPFVMSYGTKGKNDYIPRGRVVNQAANTTDWMPTFLSIAGVDCPKVAGRDLTPLLAKKPAADWNDISFVRKGWFLAVTDRYKLYAATRDVTWLIDLEKNPDETINYIDDPAYADVAKRLAKELKQYMEENDDPNPTVTEKLDNILAGKKPDLAMVKKSKTNKSNKANKSKGSKEKSGKKKNKSKH